MSVNPVLVRFSQAIRFNLKIFDDAGVDPGPCKSDLLDAAYKVRANPRECYEISESCNSLDHDAMCALKGHFKQMKRITLLRPVFENQMRLAASARLAKECKIGIRVFFREIDMAPLAKKNSYIEKLATMMCYTCLLAVTCDPDPCMMQIFKPDLDELCELGAVVLLSDGKSAVLAKPEMMDLVSSSVKFFNACQTRIMKLRMSH